MSRRLILTVLLAAALALPAAARVPRPQKRPRPPAPSAYTAKPEAGGKPHEHSLTDIPDMSKAVPASEMNTLPTTRDSYDALKSQADKDQPRVESARVQSEALRAAAQALRAKLIDTAARVQALEAEKAKLDGEIARLESQQAALSASFAHDRVAVTHLLGLLERMQHDMPPVLAISADDALSAAHQTMLLGASLPRVYGAAADLARRLDVLRKTRVALIARRAESAQNAAALSAARTQLDQLLATKQAEADTAAAQYETLSTKFAEIARQASDLGQLLNKVAAARAAGPTAARVGPRLSFSPHPGALERPVVGPVEPGGIDGVGGAKAPGIRFLTEPGGQVVAPADAKVLFAGRYHQTGQVLILDLGDGYDLVLAGMRKVDVRVGDGVLAGEPLGNMPANKDGPDFNRLYVELRHGTRAMSPLPWLVTGLRKAEKS